MSAIRVRRHWSQVPWWGPIYLRLPRPLQRAADRLWRLVLLRYEVNDGDGWRRL